ncbi:MULTISPECIES: MraY family glycosyltransferase [Actinomadura]|uniref:UDP-GlcNAc:undecaprenyl-phosphate GlcNAc-1-phosphate transferase n=1 Tax=Actinomadura madurae TaxID=1993 RepID=A0A1I5XCZ6_9ACTN|nr:MraY family glycosyltransferase [Actinomadura madurae]MCP9953608.1 undecaprenyl/decaprenyl-phosphate alpha-N-acetylglucosaminyl 1-phosphate transferase [Actinomadura madurae]MCP9970363.1 undecaprenyl/decaprenyl-phosphate alpha-N-acetylglucosaminyl 1-phosphate transferase [Actinomadura madurae]MCP9982844.1 undecaprenyl/decaprenyl-phosphate alpha-N-acetylglucosaminyl 1-phosphate transferase [Actinomadura madurae]MCQ0005605.1 undecaprenyl/decaprenyl-phosphate alpha-N-acetylglucosaminyl 1-phosph
MREYLLTILVAALVAYLLTPSVRRFAIWFGAQAVPRDRDVHVIPTPRLGGLAMFGGMVAALTVATGLPEMRKVLDDGGISVARALLLSGGLIVLIGIADDRWEVDALTKFAGQVAAAGIFIMQGIQIYVIPLPTGESLSLPPAYGVPLTVLVVVATINAVNFIDGLDGLAAGVVGIAALALFSYAYLLSRTIGLTTLTGATLIAAILFGMCLGFLPHNFSPAKIFMGDTGSMLIGLLLSASTIMLTGQFDPAILANGLFPFFVPILLIPAVAAVPFIDMLLAVWRRTNQGRSPFSPDKQHLHHRLLELGHSTRRAVLIMYFWVGLLASGLVGLALFDAAWITLGVTLAVAIAGVLLMLRIPGRRRSARTAGPGSGEQPAERPPARV